MDMQVWNLCWMMSISNTALYNYLKFLYMISTGNIVWFIYQIHFREFKGLYELLLMVIV